MRGVASVAVLLDSLNPAAVAAGADVVVLPELVTSGYMFTDAAEARTAALSADSPRFAEWAALLGDSIAVLGFCELGTDGRLYNSAAVLQSGGVPSVYRKTPRGTGRS